MLMIMMIIIIKQKTKTLQFVEVNTRSSFQEEKSSIILTVLT